MGKSKTIIVDNVISTELSISNLNKGKFEIVIVIDIDSKQAKTYMFMYK